MEYKVIVGDNYHYMDEAEAYSGGQFASWEDAVERCRKIIDDCLVSLYAPGMTAKELWIHYAMFGEDPFITPRSATDRFSAWDYARGRCSEMCEGRLDA